MKRTAETVFGESSGPFHRPNPFEIPLTRDVSNFAAPPPAPSSMAAFADLKAQRDTTQNPFSGLSLFAPSTGNGGLFTFAATSLSKGTFADSASEAQAFAKSDPTETAPTAPTLQAGAPASEAPEPPQASASAEPPEKVEESAEPQQNTEEESARDDAQPAVDGKNVSEAEPTGEEDEEVIFRAECKLWKLVKHETEWRWQERGGGILHINRRQENGRETGRLVMRMRGVLKLLLNTPIFSTRYEKVGQKSVRFVGVDPDDTTALCGFRLNLHSGDQQGKFLKVVHELLPGAGA